VDPRTQQKVNILSDGKRQLAALREVMDDAVIPVAYGGTRKPPTIGGSSVEDTCAMYVAHLAVRLAAESLCRYSRIDAWLREQNPKTAMPRPKATPAAAPAAPPATPASSPRAPRPPAVPVAASAALMPHIARVPPAKAAAVHNAAIVPAASLLDLAVLLLLWVLGTLTFATLSWVHISELRM
jgi:hypothetical protein